MTLLRQALLYLSERKNLEEFLKQNPLARKACSRFIAGDTLAEALAVTQELNDRGFAVTLDYLGEEVSTAAQAEAVTAEYAASLEEAAQRGLITGVSVKVSHLGARIDRNLALKNLREVVRRAAAVDRFVRVDMEGSDLTDLTLDLVRTIHRESPNIGAVIQSYLRRSDADIETLNEERIPVRLVKGAYLESEEAAYQDNEEIILYYMRLTEGLIHSGTRPAFATHDETLIEFVIDLADIFELPKTDFEFQMLYGIEKGLQKRILDQGFRVRIYLPYGRDWYGYFMRRLAERPANLWFLLRHIKAE